MIMGHIGFGTKFDFLIHAFHMPMFFFISGYLFNSKKNLELSFKAFFIKKFKSLLIPYILFGAIHFLISIILYGFNISYLKHLLFFNTDGLPIAGALWFLTALFITDFVYFFINKYVKKDIFKSISVIFIFLIYYLFRKNTNIIFPLALGPAISGLALYHIGFKLKEKILNINIILLILLTIINCILIFKNGYVNMRMEIYANVLLFFINSILSSIILIDFSKKLEKILNNNFISKYLQSIGKDSIIYVCLNQIVILFITSLVKYMNFPLGNYLILILSLIILYILTILITKTKLKFLIGK